MRSSLVNKVHVMGTLPNFVRVNAYFGRVGLGWLDLVSCERSSQTIQSYLCMCGWEISSWVFYDVEENFLYKYMLDWLIRYI
jgi:hypothetical protein